MEGKLKDLNELEIAQELKENKSYFLVSLLDFADQIKNQTRDSYYRIRIDSVLTDLNYFRGELVKANMKAELTKELDDIANDLQRLKGETQYRQKGDDNKEIVMDFHKVGIEYLKKRIHCDVNNLVRRISLALGLPMDKHRVEPFKDVE
jgi:hypothetical protein